VWHASASIDPVVGIAAFPDARDRRPGRLIADS
jgi:hypothetical protein